METYKDLTDCTQLQESLNKDLNWLYRRKLSQPRIEVKAGTTV